MGEIPREAITFAHGDLTLEGAFHRPEAADEPAPGAVVCHPHPQYGGEMQNNVVDAACSALVERGYAALRFNFRGVGASDGAFDQGKGEQEDTRAALRYLAGRSEVDGKRLGLIGYSFGAMVAAEVASGGLRALALVSPLVSFADLRVAWGCPALVVAGDQDSMAPADRLRVVAEAPGVEAHVIEDADHSWWGFEDQLGNVLGEFFSRHFQATSAADNL